MRNRSVKVRCDHFVRILRAERLVGRRLVVCLAHRRLDCRRKRLGKWRRNSIRDLLDLGREGSLQNELLRESLKEHRFVDAKTAAALGVYVDLSMAVGDSRTRFVPLQSTETTPCAIGAAGLVEAL